ncbi:MAG: helix-turn-helix domain-containing protein [Pseudomonadota bacterium]|nr:helix-turn-helix domain-containing protein [Pseudomonadota bacterium]
MDEDERDRLSRRLREHLIAAREAKGMTQTELARALGKSQTFVSNMERGQRRLDVVELVLIGEVLEVDVKELLGTIRLTKQ